MRSLGTPADDAPRSLGNIGTVRRLLAYLWPADAPSMRLRVVFAHLPTSPTDLVGTGPNIKSEAPVQGNAKARHGYEVGFR